MGVILVGKGMVEDHLPNHVLAALVQCKDRLLLKSPSYNPSRLKYLRKKNENLYRGVYRACAKTDHKKEEGFTFLLSETPMVTEGRTLTGSGGQQLDTHTHSEGRQLLTVAAEVHSSSETGPKASPPTAHHMLTLPQAHLPVGGAKPPHRPYQLKLPMLARSDDTISTEGQRHSESLV